LPRSLYLVTPVSGPEGAPNARRRGLRRLERRAQAGWLSFARLLGLDSREDLNFLILAPLVGLATGFTGLAIYWLIDLVQHLLWSSPGHMLAAAESAPWKLCIAAPVFGGAIVALLIKITGAEVRGHGMSGLIEAVALRGGRMAAGPAILREIAGIATVGSGGSLGREAPLIRVGATIGSFLGQTGGVHGRRLKLLLACGAAAGMAAAYNAPYGGALFAMEVILGNFALDIVGPVVIASVLSNLVATTFHTHDPVYFVPQYRLVSPWEIVAYFVLGLLSGPLSIGFARGLRVGDWFFARLSRIPKTVRPLIGMALVGAIGIGFPWIYGNGFDTVDLALHETTDPVPGLPHFGFLMLLALPAVKLLATAITLGSGCSGGLFTPTLLVGGLLGGAFGTIVHTLFPNGSAEPGAYALVGMAAITAGTSQAPISAIFIIFEMTHRYDVILPLMVSAMTSAIVARRMHPHSIYTDSLARRGIVLPSRLEEIVLETIRVNEVARSDHETVPPGEPLEKVLKRFFRSRRTHLFVVDALGIFRGAVSFHDLEPAVSSPQQFQGVVAQDLVDAEFPTTRSEESLARALDTFAHAEGDWLPVVDGDNRFRAILGKSDLLRLYAQEVLGRPALLAKIAPDGEARATFVPLPPGFQLLELDAPEELAGKTLLELELPQRYGLWVLAIVRRDEHGREHRLLATASTKLEATDRLVIMGAVGGIGKLEEAATANGGTPETPLAPPTPPRIPASTSSPGSTD
jgi:CIC family chloride channel protein